MWGTTVRPAAQNALLASVLFWIASLPLMFLSFPELSYLGLIATLVTGGLYWYWHRARR